MKTTKERIKDIMDSLSSLSELDKAILKAQLDTLVLSAKIDQLKEDKCVANKMI